MTNSKVIALFSTILKGVALGLVSLPAFGSDDASNYTLIAFSNGPGGQAVLEKDYDKAIRIAEAARRSAGWQFLAETNLCVSYTMKDMTAEAERACRSAILRAPAAGISSRPARARSSKRNLALAYSNRGVVRALAGDTKRAQQDLVKARTLQGQSPVYGQNLAHLNGEAPANHTARIEYR